MELDDYYIYKYIQNSMLNNENYENFKETIMNFPSEWLYYVYDFIIQNEVSGFIDCNIRNKFYDLISYLRNEYCYKSIEDKERIYLKCNEIIEKLNLMVIYDDKRYEILEKRKRYTNSAYMNFSNTEICNDLFYLKEFSIEMKDEILEEFTIDDKFLGSMYAIIYENPDIIYEKSFVINLQRVLEKNIHYCNYYEKYHISKFKAEYILDRTMELKKKLRVLSGIEEENTKSQFTLNKTK